MKPSSRLTRFIDLPDGLAVGEALAQATASLESHRQSALGVIDGAIADLVATSGQGPPESLARLADSIGSLAGMFELDALGQAAKRLGGLLRLFDDHATADHDLIDLHIAALRAIRAHPDPRRAAELLRGLDQISAREARRLG